MSRIKFDKDSYKVWEKRYFRNPKRTIAQLKKFNTYHKRYLLIMRESSSRRFRDEIYRIIIDKFNRDLQNLKHKKRISTLGKWMPREKSSYDRELDFVNVITRKLYPGLKPQAAKELYRKNVSLLTKKLNPIEVKLSKGCKEIDLKKVPRIALSRYIETFKANPELCRRFENEFRDRTVRLNSDTFIEELINVDRTKFEDSIIYNAFMIKREDALRSQPYLNDLMIPVIDTSTDTMASPKFRRDVMTALYLLEKTDTIVVAGDCPKLIKFDFPTPLKQKCREIFNSREECDAIDVKKIHTVLGGKKPLMILSSKPVVNRDETIDRRGTNLVRVKRAGRPVRNRNPLYRSLLIGALLSAFTAYLVKKLIYG